MGVYAVPHLEYLGSIVDDPETPMARATMARQLLFGTSPPPHYHLPLPPTKPELAAATMMAEGHMKAAELGEPLGEHLTNALSWLREPESRLRQRLAEGGPGDPFAPKIAEAMLEAGRAATQRLGCPDVAVDAALHKIESMPCPCCGREFRGE